MPYRLIIEEMKRQHLLEIQKLKEDYEAKERELKKELQKAVLEEERRIKSAWTWRAGTIVVAPLVILKEMAVLLSLIKKPQTDAERAANSSANPDGIIQPPKIAEGVVDDKVVIDPGGIQIGGILDTFTYNCFRYEFNILRPGCNNWNEVFERYPVKAIFVESAWRGNENTWKNQVGSFSKTSDLNLNALLKWCHDHHIPTIFWNKEDPVHFDYFIKDAKKFDYIFTTDEGMIPKYAEASGHNRVFSMPFAAQPAIHNPVRDFARDENVCFAGTYYNNRYVERRSDMDIILRPSLDFGLHIYDRNFGSTGQEAENYRFPDIYQPVIKGKLDYSEMVMAYKRYKVFLNVNSVKNSSTMFARRVFELLSCGTPVISTYSKGILDILGEDTVLITESESDTRRHLENLLHDEQYWWKKSLKGMRRVMEEHTYTNRTEELFKPVGLPIKKQARTTFRVYCPVTSTEDAAWFAMLLRRQSYRNFSVVLVLAKGFSPKTGVKSEMEALFPDFEKKIINLSDCKGKEFKNNLQNSDYYVFMGRNHFYGVHYLRDFALAIRYSGATVLGKGTWFKHWGAQGIQQEYKGQDFRYLPAVHNGTIVMKNPMEFREILLSQASGVIHRNDYKILSIDPYGFLENGRSLYCSDPQLVTANIEF